MTLVLPMLCAFALCGCTKRMDTRSAVTAVVQKQAQDWNNGDLHAFMEGYWNSGELTFASVGLVERGWQATLERFDRRYPSPDKMGTVAFDILRLEPLGEHAAWVLGKWSLEHPDGDRDGVFTLVLKEVQGSWVIVHDHTSMRASDKPES